MSSPAYRKTRSALLILTGLCLGGVLPAQASEDHVIKSFAAGSGPAAIGVSIGDVIPDGDKEEEGPQALTTGEDGALLLLDQLNGRILKFDPNKPADSSQSLELPKDVRPTDLVVKGQDIYVWDGKVHALQTLGADTEPTRGLTETRSAEPIDSAVETAFAQMGSSDSEVEAPGDATRAVKTNRRNDLARQPVETHGRGLVVADVAIVEGGASATIDVRGKTLPGGGARLHLHVHDKLGTVAFLDIDKDGHMYVLAENIPINISDAAFAFVARYAPTGALEGVFEVPLTSTALSRRSVTVSGDGDVYFLKTSKTAVDVIGLGFRATPNAKTVEFSRYKPNAAALAWVDPKGLSVAVGPLTRQKVLETAFAYERIQWPVTPPNYGSDNEPCSGFNDRIRVPMYMVGKQNETVRGVPYCWGCQGTVRQFVNKIQHGSLAGNVCTKDGVRNDTAGVDCSSFVSAAWGLSTHFTTAAIPAIARRLPSMWDLQPGDALDKPGSHVMLFLGFTANREAQVMEASTGGCGGRVCRNNYTLEHLQNGGYMPVRFRGLSDSAS